MPADPVTLAMQRLFEQSNPHDRETAERNYQWLVSKLADPFGFEENYAQLCDDLRRLNNARSNTLDPTEISEREWEQFFIVVDKLVNAPAPYTEKYAMLKRKADESGSEGNLEEMVAWFDSE